MAKRYRLRYLNLAQSDLLDIVRYIGGQRYAPQAAAKLVDKLDEAISRLEQFPFSGHRYANKYRLEDEHRVLVVDNYLVFYVVYDSDAIVEIRRIIYGKRNYEELLVPNP